jgi:PAS domain S-box-containing protein
MCAMTASPQEFETLNIQLLVDSIPALIHTARPDGYLDYFNKPWLQYLGVSIGEVMGWNWQAFIHPEDLEEIVATWRACLATGEIFENESRVRRANGEYRWMFHRKVPRRDARGSIIKWYGSSMDIQERKVAEEQLRQNAQELQRSEFYLAEGQRLAHMGSWAFGPAGFDYWSPELFRMHGLDPEGETPGVQEYLGHIHPHDRESTTNMIKRILAEAAPFDATKRIVRSDGEVRYIRCVGVPIAGNHSLKRYVGSAIDITENELLTQQLRRREAYLAEAQRLSHTGSFGWNISSGEIVWSEETYRIFEFAPSSKVSLQMILDRVHPQDRFSVERVTAAATRGEGIDLEHRLRLPDGRTKYLHVFGKAERNDTGGIEIIGAVMDITARKLTEIDLRRSKAHLADAQRLSRTGSVGMDVKTRRIFWSDESARIYGYAPGTEPTLELILKRVHPDDVDLLKNTLERAAQGGNHFDFEHRLLMPDGSIKHIYNLSHSFTDDAGNEEVLGAITDITERRLAEQKLAEQEMELRQMLDFTPQLVAVFGPNRERLYANRVALDYLGISLDEWRLRNAGAEVHPDDAERLKAYADRAMADGSAYELELRLRKADEHYRWFLARYNPVRDDKGQVIRWHVACTDIEYRKQAEDNLRQENIALKRAEEKIRLQEAELRQMLDLVPQLVAVFGPSHERIYANRVGLDYLGVTLEEWQQARDMRVFVHPDDGDRMRAFFDRALSTGAASQLEYRIRKSDGSYRWFLARYNPVHDELGRVARWYVAFTDIEDRKRAEERLQEENAALREEIDKASMFEEIVGTSPALALVLGHVSKVAKSDSTVLITGETGTGKELVARAIHRRSPRTSRPFISVNCAAIPRDLVASELFGHEKGAFTGATQQRLGRFELANGGTIFLDEVGELPAETQIALLRVLQEREFERVGGARSIRADVRVIAATNRDLQAAVREGSFRSDLFYRLNVFPIENPPLRERRADIPLLVEYFIDRYARKSGKTIRHVSKTTLALLETYSWPGNIRELQNVIERSVILCDSDILSIDESWLPQQSFPAGSKNQTELQERLEAQEKEMIEAALEESHGRVFGPAGAAAKLGIPRSTLESKIRSLKIDKNRFRTPSQM